MMGFALVFLGLVVLAKSDVSHLTGYQYKSPTSYEVPSGSISEERQYYGSVGSFGADRQYYHVGADSTTLSPDLQVSVTPSTRLHLPVHEHSNFIGGGEAPKTAISGTRTLSIRPLGRPQSVVANLLGRPQGENEVVNVVRVPGEASFNAQRASFNTGSSEGEAGVQNVEGASISSLLGRDPNPNEVVKVVKLPKNTQDQGVSSSFNSQEHVSGTQSSGVGTESRFGAQNSEGSSISTLLGRDQKPNEVVKVVKLPNPQEQGSSFNQFSQDQVSGAIPSVTTSFNTFGGAIPSTFNTFSQSSGAIPAGFSTFGQTLGVTPSSLNTFGQTSGEINTFDQTLGAIPSVSTNFNTFGQNSGAISSSFGQTSSVDNRFATSHTQTSEGKQVEKHLYFFSAPEEPEEVQARIITPPPPAKKNVKVIFIKTPTFKTAPIKLPVQPQNDEKTLVYVLVKKPDETSVVIPAPESTKPTKPEVFFIKYKTQKDAQEAIANIQGSENGGQDYNFVSKVTESSTPSGILSIGNEGNGIHHVEQYANEYQRQLHENIEPRKYATQNRFNGGVPQVTATPFVDVHRFSGVVTGGVPEVTVTPFVDTHRFHGVVTGGVPEVTVTPFVDSRAQTVGTVTVAPFSSGTEEIKVHQEYGPPKN